MKYSLRWVSSNGHCLRVCEAMKSRCTCTDLKWIPSKMIHNWDSVHFFTVVHDYKEVSFFLYWGTFFLRVSSLVCKLSESSKPIRNTLKTNRGFKTLLFSSFKQSGSLRAQSFLSYSLVSWLKVIILSSASRHWIIFFPVNNFVLSIKTQVITLATEKASKANVFQSCHTPLSLSRNPLYL